MTYSSTSFGKLIPFKQTYTFMQQQEHHEESECFPEPEYILKTKVY